MIIAFDLEDTLFDSGDNLRRWVHDLQLMLEIIFDIGVAKRWTGNPELGHCIQNLPHVNMRRF